MPSPVDVHVFEGTMPSGTASGPVVRQELQLPHFMKPSNCWVNISYKGPVDCKPVEAMVVPRWDIFGFLEENEPEDPLDDHEWLADNDLPTDTIYVHRNGCIDLFYTEVDYRLVVAEFGEGAGVNTQWVTLRVTNLKELDIFNPVDPDKSWLHVFPYGPRRCGDQATKRDWAGVRSYLIRGRIQAGGTELRLENNNDASGFPGYGNFATCQVVEMEGARVQRGDGQHAFGISQWEVDHVDLGKSFMVNSYRDPPNAAGGGRADEVTTDFFMFGGSGMASVGSLAGGGVWVWWQLIEVEDWYVEVVDFQPDGTASATPASYDGTMVGITDVDRTIAVFSRGWGCKNFGGLLSNEDGSRMTALLKIVDATTMRMSTRNGASSWDATAFAIQMSPRPSIPVETLGLENLQRIEQTLLKNDNVTDIAIEAVDPQKTIVWATSREPETNTTKASPVAELLNSTTLRVHRQGAGRDSEVVLYVCEFSQGVDVRRGWITGNDAHIESRKTRRVEDLEYSRSFVLAQSLRIDNARWAPSIAYSGSTMLRLMGYTGGGGIEDSDHTHYQIVQLRDESTVFQVTMSFGIGELEKTAALPVDYPEDRRFLWYTRQGPELGNIDQFSFDVRFTGVREITATRHDGGAEVWLQVFCVRTDSIDVLQRSIAAAAGVQVVDTDLPREFDPEKSAAFFPLQGNIVASEATTRYADPSYTLRLEDSTTLRAQRIEADVGNRGTWFLLGFRPAPERRSPIGPRGFYFGDREPGGECYIAKFGEVYRDDQPLSS